MSLYCKKYNYIFIHNPKTAGTTMANLLERVGSSKNSGHRSIESYKKEGIDLESTFKWGFSRNPYDRLVSAYRYHLAHITTFSKKGLRPEWTKTFNDYIVNLTDIQAASILHVKEQRHFLCIEGTPSLDFVGKYENLHDDWKYVCNKIFNKVPELENRNQGRAHGHPALPLDHMLGLQRQKSFNKHEEHLQYYTPEMIERVNQIYAKDFEIFGYEMEENR